MEEIYKLITGSFVESHRDKNEFIDSEEEDEDGGDEDIQWLAYKEVSDMNGGKNFVSYNKPKMIAGDLVDLASRKLQRCRGPIVLFKPWWQVTFLRTKISKDKFKEPKDRYAICYRLRDDPKCCDDKLAQLFISDILSDRQTGNPSLYQTRLQFEQYLRESQSEDDLDLFNLEQHLEAFCQIYADPEQKSSPQHQFLSAILCSSQYQQVKIGQSHPQLLHYLPQLLPFHFVKILHLKEDVLHDFVQCIEQEPGNMAFKSILSKRYHVLGVETTKEALIKSGLMSKVPVHEQDAIEIYEYLKKETREFGHTWVTYDRIMDVLSKEVRLWDEAMEFLNKHKVIKTQMEAGHRIVYLHSLWKAENQIANGLNSLLRQHEVQPLNLIVDFDRKDFQSIMADNDQCRAAKLIASQPVCAISGKGGCGKTFVVTKVLTAAKANRKSTAHTSNEEETQRCDYDEDMTQMNMEEDFPKEGPSIKKQPEDIKILLTAPTGKAANLLGKRANMSASTLHQVIWSYRMLKPGMEWRHKDVNVLVVDECSLVSVSTMAFLLELLLINAKLKRIVLLGDIRQLPSIEPGNFLKDTFQSLNVLGMSVELRTNHRSESQAIVDNATAISMKQYPVFDREKFILRKLPETNPENSGNDYMLQDINDDITKLLCHESLKSHINSQFISFTRQVCDAINDLCCKHYSRHRIKEFNKYAFRTGDKICCTKNGYVNIYQEKHGLMSCTKVADNKEEQEDGGVDRTILTCPVNETTICDDKSEVVEEDQKKDEPEPITQIRLCNGEIFFITAEVERQTDKGEMMTFLGLSEDGDKEKTLWVGKRQLRKSCRIRHAWARTIHTFQGSETDHVVYIVGSRSRRQNWQHVYTAVTRGRKTDFIVGQESILRAAIKRSEIRRQTGLKKQLLQLFQESLFRNLTMAGSDDCPTAGFFCVHIDQHFWESFYVEKQPVVWKLLFEKDKKLSPTHAVDSSILCPTETLKQNTACKSKIAGWLAGCTRTSLKHRLDIPGTSTADLNHHGNMNNTQVMTDILSSPAEEHDHCPEGQEEADDTSDRDSPSLLEQMDTPLIIPSTSTKFSITPTTSANTVSSKTELKHTLMGIKETDFKDENIITEYDSDNEIKTGSFRAIEDEGNDAEDIEDLSDTDSVKSESLLETPPTKDARSYTKLKSKGSENRATQSYSSNISCFKEVSSNSINKKQERVHENADYHVFTTTVSSTAKVLTDRTKSLSRDKVTSLVNSSSRDSTKEQNQPSKQTFSPKVGGPYLTTDKSGQVGAIGTLSGSVSKVGSPDVDIKQPHSNDSMWSEADDSDYLNISDSYFIVNHTSSGSIASDTRNGTHLISSKLKNGTCKDTDKKVFHRDNPYMCLSNAYMNKHKSDQSSCSQWSELEDEHYITALDLVDIENMSKQNLDDTSKHEGIETPQKTLPFTTYRQTQIVTPPDVLNKGEVIIPNTPDELPSIQRSPGVKRQLSWNPDEVSPMKKRLSTLTVE